MGYWICPKSQLRGRNVDCGGVSQVADLFMDRNLWVEWDVMIFRSYPKNPRCNQSAPFFGWAHRHHPKNNGQEVIFRCAQALLFRPGHPKNKSVGGKERES